METVAVRRVADLVRARARLMPEGMAHDDTRQRLTFLQWDAGADAVGGGLARAGVAPGDRVLLPISNRNATSLAVATIGVHRAGAIAVPVNVRWTAEEVRWFASFVGARWGLTDRPDLLSDADLGEWWPVDTLPADAAALPD